MQIFAKINVDRSIKRTRNCRRLQTVAKAPIKAMCTERTDAADRISLSLSLSLSFSVCCYCEAIENVKLLTPLSVASADT